MQTVFENNWAYTFVGKVQLIQIFDFGEVVRSELLFEFEECAFSCCFVVDKSLDASLLA